MIMLRTTLRTVQNRDMMRAKQVNLQPSQVAYIIEEKKKKKSKKGLTGEFLKFGFPQFMLIWWPWPPWRQ
jgi:hypothetical protein